MNFNLGHDGTKGFNRVTHIGADIENDGRPLPADQALHVAKWIAPDLKLVNVIAELAQQPPYAIPGEPKYKFHRLTPVRRPDLSTERFGKSPR